mmetsp:Transcript_7134/g.12739  ORF Transcript_7134/g.12739 Transcript_7134/m.12739 type:complete len:240 (-) Transcript_7134:57-776(-)
MQARLKPGAPKRRGPLLLLAPAEHPAARYLSSAMSVGRAASSKSAAIGSSGSGSLRNAGAGSVSPPRTSSIGMRGGGPKGGSSNAGPIGSGSGAGSGAGPGCTPAGTPPAAGAAGTAGRGAAAPPAGGNGGTVLVQRANSVRSARCITGRGIMPKVPSPGPPGGIRERPPSWRPIVSFAKNKFSLIYFHWYFRRSIAACADDLLLITTPLQSVPSAPTATWTVVVPTKNKETIFIFVST